VSGNDWAEPVGAAGLFILLTVVVSVAIVQVMATVRAKAALAREAEYRALAESVVTVQQAIDKQLGALAEQSEQTRQRLAAIERILADVE
jgi:hypothetical protein